MRLTKIIHLPAFGLLAAAMTACVNEPPVVSHVGVGDTVPYFSVVMDDGRTISSRSQLGIEYAIVFFTTTCPDCREEFPKIQEAWENLPPTDDKRLRIVCISREEDSQSVSEYWHEHDLTLPFSAQTDRTVYSLFASEGVPRIYVVNPEGIIIKITEP